MNTDTFPRRLLPSSRNDVPPKTAPRFFDRIGLQKGGKIPKKRHKPEENIPKLRQAEVELSRGLTVPHARRKISVTEQTYYRWRKAYGGVRTDQVKRLKTLEKENPRLM